MKAVIELMVSSSDILPSTDYNKNAGRTQKELSRRKEKGKKERKMRRGYDKLVLLSYDYLVRPCKHATSLAKDCKIMHHPSQRAR